MAYVVHTEHGDYACDTWAEACSFLGGSKRNPTAAYRAGVAAARRAVGKARNPDPFFGLQLHRSYRILGHRVRLVDNQHVVVDGIRCTRTEAAAKLREA